MAQQQLLYRKEDVAASKARPAPSPALTQH